MNTVKMYNNNENLSQNTQVNQHGFSIYNDNRLHDRQTI